MKTFNIYHLLFTIYHLPFRISDFGFRIYSFVSLQSLCVLCLLCALCASCKKDDTPNITEPTAIGTFTDERDGTEYHYITIGSLDWSAENLRYDLGDRDLCVDYQSPDAYALGNYSTEYRERFGMLYTQSAIASALPTGWRLPTDEEWTALEQSYGYLSEAFGLLYGGYYTKNTHADADNGFRFMGSWAYFWSSTKDESKSGEYYFARKKFYSEQDMVRLSIEPNAYFLSVRIVRNHQ
jgi:uncharacterized protein (TIGR02145 family)